MSDRRSREATSSLAIMVWESDRAAAYIVSSQSFVPVMKFALIIPAAGSGSRAGGPFPKQFVELVGRSILAHAVLPFASLHGCQEIIVAIDPLMREKGREGMRGIDGVRFVDGGSHRQYSIARAIDALESDAPLLLVHDGARPCITTDVILRVLEGAAAVGAAVPVVPVVDTLKRIGPDGLVVETIDRSTLRRIQTPQGFRRELLAQAYAHADAIGLLGTDDASLVESLGHPVLAVDGDPVNIKVTSIEDFAVAETWLRGEA